MTGIRFNPPDLDALDVALTWGRRPESDLLRSYINDQDTRGILVTGAAGIGKTGMVNGVVESPNPRFPGGILEIDESDFHRRNFSFPKLSDITPPTIILVDCKNLSPPRLMLRSYERASEGRSDKCIVIARTEALAARGIELPTGFVQLEVKGFSEPEYISIARKIARYNGPKSVGKRAILELHRLSGGNPRILANAFMLFRSGVSGSIEDLVTNLRDFQRPVIWGPDGKLILFSQARRIITDVRATNAELIRLLQQQPELSRSLPSRKFEEIVAELLSGMGYEVTLSPQTRDGGLDVYAAAKTGLGTFLYLVECKRYAPTKKVGVGILRALNGVIDPYRANKAAIVTTSFFTKDALNFHSTQEHRIDLHDYVVLQKWLNDFSDKR